MNNVNVRTAQKPLRRQYVSDPGSAMVLDRARTTHPDLDDPFHSTVEPMPGCGISTPVGVHQALGGPHDAPTPGDILCAALAACADSTVRMVANIIGVELEHLEVSVGAEIDVRGTMMVARDVPVGFQAMRCQVDLRAKAGTSPALLGRLRTAAEQSCVVLQTLRQPPPVQMIFNVA